MTENKAKKAAIRERMAETGEPYSVARHAVQDGQPDEPEDTTAQPRDERVPDEAGDEQLRGDQDWVEQYYADGAATEGITVEEFKARHAPGQTRQREAGARRFADPDSGQAEQARRRADLERERADWAREQADLEQERAEWAAEQADLEEEQADLEREWDHAPPRMPHPPRLPRPPLIPRPPR